MATAAVLAILWPARSWPECKAGAPAIPPGYLHTRGNQIVAANGQPVRLVGIGWNGMNITNGQLDGLDGPFKGMDANLRQIRRAGFNTIRVSWTDVSLRNPRDMAVYHRLVRGAGRANLRIIFDHHQNEGTSSANWACSAQQVNGLWFDLGPGTDGTNGCGDRGTVTAEKFKQNSVSFARLWAGNPTVIGFDLDNEPTSAGNINWGMGGPTDIHAMCTDVGNAILTVNPGALIICEGPIEYRGAAEGLGMTPGVPAPEGDLSGVAKKPVVLNIPDKVVYSVHEYPTEVNGYPINSGPEYIKRMNQVWGYLVSQDIAPVWIGEMGASMKSASSRAWAATLIPYMNGTAPGGIRLRPGALGVSGSWWLWGNLDKQNPNGYLQRNGRPRPEQERVVRQLMNADCTTSEASADRTQR